MSHEHNESVKDFKKQDKKVSKDRNKSTKSKPNFAQAMLKALKSKSK